MVRRGNEDGAAMAEYIPLLAVIAVIVVVAVSFVGPWVRETVIDASVPLYNTCPPSWDRMDAGFEPEKKNGIDANTNGDPFVCVKEIPGGGNGNTGARYNIKDNNRPPMP